MGFRVLGFRGLGFKGLGSGYDFRFQGLIKCLGPRVLGS